MPYNEQRNEGMLGVGLPSLWGCRQGRLRMLAAPRVVHGGSSHPTASLVWPSSHQAWGRLTNAKKEGENTLRSSVEAAKEESSSNGQHAETIGR